MSQAKTIGTVLRILQSTEKGGPRKSLEQGDFVAGKGLLGDRLFDKKPEIPVLSIEDRRRLDAAVEQGLCYRRFVETLTVGFTREPPRPLDRLQVGEAVFEVSGRKKRCFPECVLIREKKECPLREGVVYLKVVQSGRVLVGQSILKPGGE